MNKLATSVEILRTESVTKSFPGVRALEKVTFICRKGEVHALVGENGAGKSTLVGILMGIHQPDEGRIVLKGKKVTFKGPSDARGYGIEAVFQESSLIPYMSIAENIFLGRENEFTNKGFISSSSLRRQAEPALAEVGLDLDVSVSANLLNSAEEKLVEIAKALITKPKLLILDEVTAPLDKEGVEKLFEIIRNLKKQGITVVFISHRLHEVLEIADVTSILRDGKLIDDINMDRASESDLVRSMTGKEFKIIFPPRNSEIPRKRRVLSVKNFKKKGVIEGVNLDIYEGEIVALAGLKGQGQSELLRMIYGLLSKDEGEIYIQDRKVKINRPSHAIKYGLARLSDRRDEEELCLTHSVQKNLALASLDRRKQLGFIKGKEEKTAVQGIVSRFSIHTPSLNQEVVNLSGGNRQKVVLGKWTLTEPQILLCDEPTKGLDVGAKSEVYYLLRGLARIGRGILVVLSDMGEILHLSDRILVMREGRITAEFLAEEATEEKVLKASMGIK